MRNLFILFIFSIMTCTNAFAAAGAGGSKASGIEEDYDFFNREEVLRNVRLLGEVSALYGEETRRGRIIETEDGKKHSYISGINLVVLGDEERSPDAVLTYLIRQFTYNPNLYSPEVVEAGERMKETILAHYKRASDLAKMIIKTRPYQKVREYFDPKLELLGALARNSVFFNRVQPNRRKGEHFLERARLKAEAQCKHHSRWSKVLFHVTSPEMLEEEEDPARFASLPEQISGSRLMMMPVMGWAVENMAEAYEDALRRFTRMLIGRYHPDDFLDFLTTHRTYTGEKTFPPFVNDNAEGDFKKMLMLFHDLYKKKQGGGPAATQSEQELAFARIASPEKSREKLEKPKKAAGKKGRKKPTVYVEHALMSWLKEVRENFKRDWEGFVETVQQYRDHLDGVREVPDVQPVEEERVRELREQVRIQEQALAEEAVRLEEAERKRKAAEEAYRARQERIAQEREERQAQEARRLEAFRAERAEREAERQEQAERRAQEAREIQEARLKAEEEEELRRLEALAEIERANSQAALEKVEEKRRKQEEYQAQLEDATATIAEEVEARVHAAEEGPALSTEIRKRSDRDLFAQIFTPRSVDYDRLLIVLNSLQGITVDNSNSARPHIYFDMPDGSSEMIVFHKPHRETTLQRPTQDELAAKLIKMGYTKEHFGLE